MSHHYITLACLNKSSYEVHYVGVEHFVVQCFYLKILSLEGLQLFKQAQNYIKSLRSYLTVDPSLLLFVAKCLCK